MTDVFDTDLEGDPFDPEFAERVAQQEHNAQVDEDEAVSAYIRRMQAAYKGVFSTGTTTQDDLDFVMQDLAWFAKQDQHFFSEVRMQDLHAGRKQVLQRVMEYTRLDHDTLLLKYIEAQT